MERYSFVEIFQNLYSNVYILETRVLGYYGGIFFRLKFFGKYCRQTVNFPIFVSLLYMGEKIFYAPRTFGFSCPWLSEEKFFSQKFSEIPQQKRCNFPI